MSIQQHMAIHPLYLVSSIRKRTLHSVSKRQQYCISGHALCYITQGRGEVLLDGRVEQLQPYELYCLSPGTVVDTSGLIEPVELYVIIFRACSIQGIVGPNAKLDKLPPDIQVLPFRNDLPDPQRIHQCIIEMHKQFRAKVSESVAMSYSLRMALEKLIYELQYNERNRHSEVDQRIVRSIAHMENMYPDKINIHQLAEIAELTPATYSRLFKKTIGLSPVEYLTRLRIDKAKQLLAKEGSRVKEVSTAVGFSSEFYFSRTFQRIVNVSPTIYMKRDKLRVAIASSLGFEDYLLSLGIEPVSIIDLYQYPGVNDKQYVLVWNEQWARLKLSHPDIIIGDHYHLPLQNELTQVAPFVHIDSPTWNWRANYLQIAELVNKEQEARQSLFILELRTAEMRGVLRNQISDHRVTVMQVTHDTVRIQGTQHHPLNELLYSELALQPGAQVTPDVWRWEVSPEALPHLDTEHLFIHKHHLQAGSERLFRRIEGSQVWQNNEAVLNNNVNFIPNWFLWSWTPVGRLRIMDYLAGMKH